MSLRVLALIVGIAGALRMRIMKTSNKGESWTKTSASQVLPCCQTSASGDPKVTNVRGETFDILKNGEHNLLHILSSTGESMLHIQAHVLPSVGFCKATYIRNITVSGKWMDGVLSLRAVPASLKGDILEMKREDTDWGLARTQNSTKHVERKPWKGDSFVVIHVKDVNVTVSSDIHLSTHSYFLNVDVSGLGRLNSVFAVNGLLGNDDHSSVSQKDAECKAAKDFHFLSTAKHAGSNELANWRSKSCVVCSAGNFEMTAFTGNCKINSNGCIENKPYSNNDYCVWKALTSMQLYAQSLATEDGYDEIRVKVGGDYGNPYYSASAFNSASITVQPNNEIIFQSDSIIDSADQSALTGFEICRYSSTR